MVTPREIKRLNKAGLQITWGDGTVNEIDSKTLRSRCPCAECREKRGDSSHSKPLTSPKRALNIVSNTLEEELSLEEVWAIGQYAIGIKWGDSHSSGIYTFGFIRDLILELETQKTQSVAP
jgi:ATP-binding protein involved in chromosome partitioning